MPQQSLVLLVEPKGARNQGHTKALVGAGFRVQSVASEEADPARVLERRPAVVTLNLARRSRKNPQARLIPFIIYGHQRPTDRKMQREEIGLDGRIRIRGLPVQRKTK